MGFLYYSGHGAAEADTRRNYLIPIDAKYPGTESFWDESVRLDDILGLLNGASAAAKFVVFDACRNELRLPYRGAKGFEPVREQPGVYVAYTTAPGQPALDDGETSGPYAAALAAEFAKPGQDHLSLFQNVKEAVYAATRGAQQPWATDGLVRRVYLTGQPRPVSATPAPEKADDAAQAWSAVQNTSSEAVLEEFARRFPDSVYAGFAKARLQELRAARQALNVPKSDPVKPKPAVGEDACDGLLVSVAMGARPCIKPGSGQSFKDCADCPEMVIAPSGSFTMGSPPREIDDLVREYKFDWYKNEGPQHKVTIPKPFAVGQFAVTFAEWDACVAAGGCGGYKPEDQGWGRGDRPVINVSWDDAKAYVAWLSKKTGKSYRLLSEAEREYVARAGTATPFWWGSSITPEQANYNGNYVYAGGQKGEYRSKTLPVKSFKPNPWGLYQVHGNVYDWVEDCYHDSYNGAPTDGSAWTSGDCTYRVLRGGSWYSISAGSPRGVPRQVQSSVPGRQ